MSRFTSTPFANKNKAHGLLRPATHPPSPPETDWDSLGHAASVARESAAPTMVDLAAERFRRTSSLTYKQSGPASRENQRQTSKLTKWLILVLPPRSLPQEPFLGSTLSTAPPGRLASGMLMPLYSTLYAQLAAIAREYAMPSTTGLCVYLHVADGGTEFNPRLSDEAWQLVWAHFVAPENYDRSPTLPSHQLPICGRVEFDIDVRKAKWYTSWMNGHIRHLSDETDVGSEKRGSVPYYGEDRDGAESEVSAVRTLRLGASAPRRLSLLDRRDVDLPSIKAPLRTPSRLAQFETETSSSRLTRGGSKPLINALSPVVQVEEPLTGSQKDITAYVRQWRDSNTPTAPPNIPPSPSHDVLQSNNEDAPNSATQTTSPIDPADYAWSISSRGPPSPVSTTESEQVKYWGSPLPSPDIAARVIEDSPHTPSTATTWGAPSEYPPTPSSVDRLPSPDIAARMMEDCPNTPSTATTWGAPSIYPPTPASFDRLPSPDLAQRMLEDAPLTASTSMSEWVRPQDVEGTLSQSVSYPASSTESVAEREEGEESPAQQPDQAVTWPFLREDGIIFPFVWPFTLQHAPWSEGPLALQAPEESQVQQPDQTVTWSFLREDGIIFPFVWPFILQQAPRSGGPLIVEVPEESSTQQHDQPVNWPFLKEDGIIFPFVWPFVSEASQGAPSVDQRTPMLKVGNVSDLQEDTSDNASTSTSPARTAVESPIVVRLAPSYPTFDLYPTGYPDLHIYPAVRLESPLAKDLDLLPVVVRLAPSYPTFDLYPAGYPNLCIYPAVRLDSSPVKKLNTSPKSLSVRLPPHYPSFDLYGTSYPVLEIYPSVQVESSVFACGNQLSPVQDKSLSVRLAPVYPSFNIYGAAYPVFDIYPSTCLSPPSGAEAASIGISCARSECKALPVNLGSSYPFFNLYPSSYPDFNIYPSLISSSPSPSPPSSATVPSPLVIALSGRYPFFNIFPAVYPHVEPYGCASTVTLDSPTPLRVYRPSKTHAMLHKAVFEAMRKERNSERALKIELPLITSKADTTSALPSDHLVSSPPPDSVSQLSETPEQQRSREELHNLIFGGNALLSVDVAYDEPQSLPLTARSEVGGLFVASPLVQELDWPVPTPPEKEVLSTKARPTVDTAALDRPLPSVPISAVEPFSAGPPQSELPPIPDVPPRPIGLPSRPVPGRRASVSARHAPVLSRIKQTGVPEDVIREEGLSPPAVSARPATEVSPRRSPVTPAKTRQPHPRIASSPFASPTQSQTDFSNRSPPLGSPPMRSNSVSIQKRQALFNSPSSHNSTSALSPRNSTPRRSVSRSDPSKYPFLR